ncbi:MAG: amidohydrolase family protein [Burkholderiaceae bacterium]
MPKTTVIRGADWVIGWDEAGQGHRYLRDADVVFRNDRIVQVGGTWDGPVDDTVPGAGRLVMPGLINTHSHPLSEPLRKGITDEVRSPNFHHSSLYEYINTFNNDAQGLAPCHRVGMAELLLSGCTSVVDFSPPFDGWLELLAESGIRAWAAPSFRDATWSTRNGHSVDYDWGDGQRGRAGFERARAVCEQVRARPDGLLSAVVAPGQVDTVGAPLLRQAHEYAQANALPMQIHAGQSVVEFHEMIRRHGRTPVQWMADLGILSRDTCLAHAIFLDHHPWLHWSTREDLALLAAHQVSVAHSPTVFLRRGMALHTFGSYLRAGVNLTLGTDTYPFNLLDEMRTVAYTARAVAGTVDDLSSADVFNAATLGAARWLRRDDLGRLAPGSKADLVLVDLTHPAMRPMREPLRSLIYVAGERAVSDVWVDGRQLVRGGRCLTIDLPDALDGLQAAQRRSMAGVATLDHAGRDALALAPMVFGGSDG